MQPSQLYDEKILFRQIAEGDENAFTVIFYRYKSSLFDYAVKVTKSQAAAEELVQDCFLKLWSSRQNLSGVDNPGGYLHTMAKNAAMDYLRKLSSDTKLQQKVWASMRGHENATLEDVNLNEAQRIINEAVQQLSFHKQQVFYLSRHEGLSYEEIASRLGITKNTVKNHLVKALKSIREYLQSKYGPVVVLIIMSFLEKNVH